MSGPLASLRVVELAGMGPAPMACTLLSNLGAEVLRVIRPGDSPDGFEKLGRDRTILELNVKDPDDKAKLFAAIEKADVLIEAYRPGVAERLGVGPDECLALNPRLIYARMTGWGQTGPAASTAGHDINYLGLTGALHAIGEPGRAPVPPLNLVADFGGGTMFVLLGILAALHERSNSGRGQVVDAAMVDGASFLMAMIYRYLNAGMWSDERGTNTLDGGAPFYAAYECADGRFMAVGAIEPQFYEELIKGLGLTDPPSRYDKEQWPALRKVIAERFLTRTRDEWTEIFGPTDACTTPVLSMAEAPHGEHLVARGTFVQGVEGMEPASAPRFSRSDNQTRPVVPAEELLKSWGIS